MTENDADYERSERSIKRYPSISLPEAVAALEAIHRNVGVQTVTRVTVAEALGYGGLNGTSRGKIAAVGYYKLLDRVGERVRISPLGTKIVIPRSEEERWHAIMEAALQPALFAELMERHGGHPLPPMLRNLLIREHGLAPNVSETVERNFRETMEFAGLLVDGVLRRPSSTSTTGELAVGTLPPTQTEAAKRDGGQFGRPHSDATDDSTYRDYTIPLGRDGRTAIIRMPLPLSGKDIRKLQAWSSYMLTALDDEDESP